MTPNEPHSAKTKVSQNSALTAPVAVFLWSEIALEQFNLREIASCLTGSNPLGTISYVTLRDTGGM